MAKEVGIRIEGMREFRGELRRADGNFPKELRLANKQAVADVAVPKVKANAPVLSGALRGSVRALASQTRAQVAVGKASVPYVFPINFGWPSRGIKAQEFVYSSLAKASDELTEKYGDMIDRLMRRAFNS